MRRRPLRVLLVTAALAAVVLVLAMPSVGLAWTQPNNLPDVEGFNCVTATDMNHVWAGSDDFGPTGGIYFYDGSSWTRQSDFRPNRMFGLDENHVWAVGGTVSKAGIIKFFDGTSWKTQYELEIDGSSVEINSISALDANHVWAVGGSIYEGVEPAEKDMVILFFDGNSWQVQKHEYDDGLLSVDAVDTSHVWAVGLEGKILFYNGSTWSEQNSGTQKRLNGVTAVDPNHVWAVGGDSIVGASEILFNDGSGWSKQGEIASEDGTLWTAYEVAAIDENHVYAVASFYVGTFDGISWTSNKVTGWDPLLDVCTVQGKYVIAVGGAGKAVFLIDNPGEYVYYFAEGTTRDGFNEWLCLQNPGDEAIEVNATYMLFGDEPIDMTYSVAPTSRLSINVNNEVGPGRDVSVRLAGEEEFYAERPMYFSYKHGVPGFEWTGGHCAVGTKQPDTDWYFAEGTTRDGFEEWVCVQNPNSFDSEVTIDYIFAGAYTQQKKYIVGANSRLSIFVNGDVGPGQDVSVHAYSDNQIVVERPVYFNYQGLWSGGHVVMGTQTPQATWYFAEGTTRPGYDQYLAIQNANTQDANVTIRFQKTDGTESVGNEIVRANSRWTLKVNERLGPHIDSSVVVESDLPVVAERPMYFNYQQGMPGYSWTGGHDVVGAPTPKTRWSFAEGCTLGNFDEYICVGNPGDEAATIEFEFMLGDGQVLMHSEVVGPRTRATVKVWEIVGREQDVSTTMTSNKPVVAERPMYFNYQNVWTGGHDVIGF